MSDGTEKPKIPSKFAIRAARYNEFAESTVHLLISGDFNLHVDDPCSIYANRFNEILESCNLKQHVTGATHANGHTLDLVISKKDNPLITEIKIFDPVISDHCAVHFNLREQKLHFTKKKGVLSETPFFGYCFLL